MSGALIYSKESTCIISGSVLMTRTSRGPKPLRYSPAIWFLSLKLIKYLCMTKRHFSFVEPFQLCYLAQIPGSRMRLLDFKNREMKTGLPFSVEKTLWWTSRSRISSLYSRESRVQVSLNMTSLSYINELWSKTFQFSTKFVWPTILSPTS